MHCEHTHTHTHISLTEYVEGTFTLIWKKQKGVESEDEELFQSSSATLYESGMEGGKEYLVIQDKDGQQPETKRVSTVEPL